MRKSRLEWSAQRRLEEHIVSDSKDRTATSLVDVNKSKAALYFHRLRVIIAQDSEDASPFFVETEVDESYLGGHRKGKHGRGAADKAPMWAIKKRGKGLGQSHPQREGSHPERHHRH